MIIENQAMVTEAVVDAVSRADDPRLRQILLALVRHLHGFVREVHLTEREFQALYSLAWRERLPSQHLFARACIARLGGTEVAKSQAGASGLMAYPARR